MNRVWSRLTAEGEVLPLVFVLKPAGRSQNQSKVTAGGVSRKLRERADRVAVERLETAVARTTCSYLLPVRDFIQTPRWSSLVIAFPIFSIGILLCQLCDTV